MYEQNSTKQPDAHVGLQATCRVQSRQVKMHRLLNDSMLTTCCTILQLTATQSTALQGSLTDMMVPSMRMGMHTVKAMEYTSTGFLHNSM